MQIETDGDNIYAWNICTALYKIDTVLTFMSRVCKHRLVYNIFQYVKFFFHLTINCTKIYQNIVNVNLSATNVC